LLLSINLFLRNRGVYIFFKMSFGYSRVGLDIYIYIYIIFFFFFFLKFLLLSLIVFEKLEEYIIFFFFEILVIRCF
jgi:hypothetical protein